MDKFSEMSHADRIAYLASKVALAKSYDSPVLTVPTPDLEILLAELEAKDDELELEREKSRRVMSENHQQEERIAELERVNKAQDDHINQQQDRIDSLEKTNSGLGRGLAAAKTNAEYYKSAFEEQRDHADILEKRLATPVRLPDIRSDDYHETGWFQHMKYYRDVERAISAAGFTVEGDK